jgi:hypothetical protein
MEQNIIVIIKNITSEESCRGQLVLAFDVDINR